MEYTVWKSESGEQPVGGSLPLHLQPDMIAMELPGVGPLQGGMHHLHHKDPWVSTASKDNTWTPVTWHCNALLYQKFVDTTTPRRLQPVFL